MAGLAALLLAGCGSAAGGIPTQALEVSARDAYLEARSGARAWDGDSALRYVEGDGIGARGLAAPEAGVWRFHYTAPGRTQALVVEVAALETASAERAPTSPPGYVIGDNVLDGSWVDSPEAVAAIAEAGGGPVAPLSFLLVPTEPEQWVVRSGDGGTRWRVDARTGELLAP